MHGCSSGFVVLVNAEVDSMGGVIDGGIGIATKPSLQEAAIEKAQAELRKNYDFREKTRVEIEFLEKGGDPLEFKSSNTASVSVQSTSLADQHPEQFVTSEAKASFAVTTSPHGDSVDSSGRLGAPSVCEPNSADNLMLFDGENEYRETERNPVHPLTSYITPPEQFSQLDVSQNAKESGDSAAFGLPKKAYKRRVRSRPNRDGARSSSTDVASSRGGPSFLPSRHVSRDVKGLVHDTTNKEQNFSSNSYSKPTSPNTGLVHKSAASDTRVDMELVNVQVVDSAIGLTKVALSTSISDANAAKNSENNPVDELLKPDGQETCVLSEVPESVDVGEDLVLVGYGCPPLPKVENQAISRQMNGFGNIEGERKSFPNESQNKSAVHTIKGLESDSSCTQTSQSLDGNNAIEVDTTLKNVNSNGSMDQNLGSEEVAGIEGNKLVKEKDENKADNVCLFSNINSNSSRPSHHEHGAILKTEEKLESESVLQNDVKHPVTVSEAEPDGCNALETDRKPSNLLASNSTAQEGNTCNATLEISNDPFLEPAVPVQHSTVHAEQTACSHNNLKIATKEHEDSILEEARIIEAKRKRIAELSVGTLPSQNCRKSHWDFVLEEMSWLANDFVQERVWKINAAAQISSQVAFTSRLRFQQKNSLRKQKEVARILAEAVMEFWHTVEATGKDKEVQCLGKDSSPGLQRYAMRFLNHNGSHAHYSAAPAPAPAPGTPDRISDSGIMDISWEDHLTEENLFYTVPPGAIEAYRKSIESHLLQCEKTGSSLQEEVETSGYDAVAENVFEEDEGETSTYYLPGAFEGSRSSKSAQKKNRNLKIYGGRSYETGADLSFTQSLERNVGTQQPALVGKRPANSLNVTIPIKRVRTASRPRVSSPYNAGTSGCVQAPNRTDASSGDTSSYQDDQSTLHGGSQIPNNMEAESVGVFEKQLQFESTEISNKPKKKKKGKHLGSTYDQRWPLESNFQNDQRDTLKRKLESHQFDSNGSSGLFGQHIMKKPKMMRQALDNSFDCLTPMTGSVPSPAASQMSNMSNSNRFIKLLGVRDRGRKAKALKTPPGQPGSGSPWSLFEDQALVVLVHDMGPNWELISDAINSTLQFKRIFRKSKECKERHKTLMDSSTGDGADSAEDSGSSQPYPSTLPGIPEGSARQLFQCLQGPMEEDTLKSHFEKIIMIGQKQHYRRAHNDSQDPKQLQAPHTSHTLALSQVSPNNLNGGPVLTPLDLYDATASSPDVLPIGYQGPHTGGLPIPNQGTAAPILPASGSNSSVQGSSNVALGNNFSSPSGQLNPSVREGRYSIPRMTSLSIEEQHRLQYNQISRNIQQSSLPVPGSHNGTDRGVRMLASRNGMGVMCGLNRSMPMARPGFQGISSSSMLTSGSMLSSGMLAMPSPVNMHSGANPGQGNTLLRPRDAMHMMRPYQTEHQRMITPELQMQQVSQGGNSQGIPPYAGGLSLPMPNQTIPSTAQSYPLPPQQPHPISPQQSLHVLSSNSHHHHHHHLQGPPNHASNAQNQPGRIRYNKERQLQQQRLQQQQQQFATSNPMVPHAQPQQSQLPISSPQNNTQIQSRSSPPVSLSPMVAPSSMAPMPQHNAPKHQVPSPHGLVRNNAQTGGSQMVKQQRQRQPQQLGGRQHPQQRQQGQSQQQSKLLKGGGRGSMMVHQNLPTDPSLENGFSGAQSFTDKGEHQTGHILMQQGGLYSGPSALNSVQSSSKQSVASHSSLNQSHQQKTYSALTQTVSAKQQQKPSHSSDNSNNQAHVSSVVASPGTPSGMASSNHQQAQPQPQSKLVNQGQPATAQRMFQQNRQASSSDSSASKMQARELAQADQPYNSSQMLTVSPMPQAQSIDGATSEVPVVSSANAPQWNTSEPFYESSGVLPDQATHFSKNSIQTSNAGTGNESSGPVVNQGQVQRQSSCDSLPNPVVNDVSVQWQQQQQQQQPSS